MSSWPGFLACLLLSVGSAPARAASSTGTDRPLRLTLSRRAECPLCPSLVGMALRRQEGAAPSPRAAGLDRHGHLPTQPAWSLVPHERVGFLEEEHTELEWLIVIVVPAASSEPPPRTPDLEPPPARSCVHTVGTALFAGRAFPPARPSLCAEGGTFNYTCNCRHSGPRVPFVAAECGTVPSRGFLGVQILTPRATVLRWKTNSSRSNWCLPLRTAHPDCLG